MKLAPRRLPLACIALLGDGRRHGEPLRGAAIPDRQRPGDAP